MASESNYQRVPLDRSHHTLLSNSNHDGNSSQPEQTEFSFQKPVEQIWSALTFSWVRPLLTLGNQRPLEQSDLYDLSFPDSANGVYSVFRHHWDEQLLHAKDTNSKLHQAGESRNKFVNPSLTSTFINAFGAPFLVAGWLKLVHDSCLFVGPMLLNQLIQFLNDPSKPVSFGLWCVLGLFLSNFLMSLCLRQYFWWCFRVGMRLRSAIITAVFSKSLVLSSGVFSRRTSGEITNLMSVDSTRLQDLTPYLHAIWYSLYQIIIALYLLYQQVGVSCFAAVVIILLTIPLTKEISKYLKTVQKELSKIRDERVKICNEVLTGMKVIKLQAWENEHLNRIKTVREKELSLFRKYVLMQSCSGTIYSTIPIVVALSTFMTYISFGNTLDVGTALTSLALFDILRFPLFMLPNVMNNLVEARVSIDRVERFLMEHEREEIDVYPLTQPGMLMEKACFYWEGIENNKKNKKNNQQQPASSSTSSTTTTTSTTTSNLMTIFNRIYSSFFIPILQYTGIHSLISFLRKIFSNPISSSSHSLTISPSFILPRNQNNKHNNEIENNNMNIDVIESEEEFLMKLFRSEVRECEDRIDELEWQLNQEKQINLQLQSTILSSLNHNNNNNNSNNNKIEVEKEEQKEEEEGKKNDLESLKFDGFLDPSYVSTSFSSKYSTTKTASSSSNSSSSNSSSNSSSSSSSSRLVTLSRIDLKLKQGMLIGIVGQVGSGKSSILNGLLGEMKCLLGQVSCLGSISYASQRPYIQNATLKENILFGLEYNERKYKDVLWRAALTPDLKVLPAGDQTEIGERGINLSGGQKARVSLARALYKESDIYLFDDPLAAVDSHVGSHLFKHAILPLVQSQHKAVLLVTNSLPFLRMAHLILVLKNGQIVERGTYESLLEMGREQLPSILSNNNNHHNNNNLDEGKGAPRGGCFYEMIRTYDDSLKTQTKNQSTESSSSSSSLSSLPTLSSSSSSSVTFQIEVEDDVEEFHDDDDDEDFMNGNNNNKNNKKNNNNKGRNENELHEISIHTDQDDNRGEEGEDGMELVEVKNPLSNNNHKNNNNKQQRKQKNNNNLSSSSSSSSSSSITDSNNNNNNMKEKGKLITTEEREEGDVDIKVYMKWLICAGGKWLGFMFVFLYYSAEAVGVASSWWLSVFAENNNHSSSSSSSSTSSPSSSSSSHSQHSAWYYLFIYGAINFLAVFLFFVREVFTRLHGLQAARELMNQLLHSVLFAPMSFFDTTPLGRITNRFSKDIYSIDEQIPQTIRGYLSTMARVTGVLIYVIVITPLFSLALIPVCFIYYFAQRFYIKTSRELSRLDSTSRSPIYALFSETLDGLSTIRAFKSEDRLREKNNQFLDKNQQAYFLNFSANCWLAVRLEFAGTLIITFAALFAVLGRSSVEGYGTVDSQTPSEMNPLDESKRREYAAMAGLAISLALSVTQSLNWTVRMASDLESQMVSVERVNNYSNMAQEAPHFLPHSDPPKSSSWPSLGGIVWNNVSLRYRPGLPLVLRGVNMTIQPREKIGIAGRTGAGKSSLVTALLRLVELEGGSIVIDGVDISRIGLNTLRRKMAVIPQDPVLFSGTVRSNLDPFSLYSDAEIYTGLRRTTLTSLSLTDKIDENGSNFSVGQRQLLCIARALLSEARIIIMDEATAAVDVETDALIQRVLKEEFRSATTLTVAHRLNTIMESDRVLVMEEGQVAEFDTPAALLENPNSMFYSLVKNWEKGHQ